MSGNDNLVMNNLERALSTDVNDLQSIAARVLAEISRYSFRKRESGVPFIESDRSIAMGLAVAPAGPDVVVGPGVLMQTSALLPPIPGPFDSTYRLARLDSAATITGPAPAANTWYLVEAQMVPVTTVNAVRDVYNPVTSTFAPALVPKVVVQSIQLQIVPGVGANLPLPSGGDWVPIAGVEWPAGGGAPLRIVDMRPSPDMTEGGWSATPQLREQAIKTASVPGTPSDDIEFVFAAANEYGTVDGSSNGAIDPTSTDYLEPGTVLAGDTWFYLYASSWSIGALKPQSAQPGPATSRGVVVLSATPPTSYSLIPSAPITLPPPYSAWSSAATPVCIGALRRNPANTGWLASQEIRGEGRLELSSGLELFNNTNLAVNTVTDVSSFATFAPEHARTIVVRYTDFVTNPVGTPFGTFHYIRVPAGAANWDSRPTALEAGTDFEWPIEMLGNPVEFQLVITPIVGNSADFQTSGTVVGWKL